MYILKETHGVQVSASRTGTMVNVTRTTYVQTCRTNYNTTLCIVSTPEQSVKSWMIFISKRLFEVLIQGCTLFHFYLTSYKVYSIVFRSVVMSLYQYNEILFSRQDLNPDFLQPLPFEQSHETSPMTIICSYMGYRVLCTGWTYQHRIYNHLMIHSKNFINT
jgi:hypothetical protein